MKPYKLVLLACAMILGVSSQALAQTENNCVRKPLFIKKTRFNPERTGISTSEKHQIGLVLVELLVDAKSTQALNEIKRGKVYQDSSWKMGGYLSGFVFDAHGNIFTVPTPFVSILHNPPSKQNFVYKIDSKTGVMKAWKALPISHQPSPQNSYGLVSIAYNCSDSSLFVSTLMGSNRSAENGIIYHLSSTTGAILDSLIGVDALSVSTSFIGNEYRLYYGQARSSTIQSIAILPNGRFDKKSIRTEISLDDLGIRGDDKARKIKWSNGKMIVTGMEFNYTLQATSELPESYYTFSYNSQSKRWELQSIY